MHLESICVFYYYILYSIVLHYIISYYHNILYLYYIKIYTLNPVAFRWIYIYIYIYIYIMQ